MKGVKDLIGPLVGLVLVLGGLVYVMRGGFVEPRSGDRAASGQTSAAGSAEIEARASAGSGQPSRVKGTPVPGSAAQGNTTQGNTTQGNTTQSPGQGEIRALLSQLKVAKRERGADYDRIVFGEGWIDVDNNTCFTRADILARDLEQVNKKGRCKVQSGILHDPYTGKTIPYTAGPETSEAVQIDHVVALLDAWGTGAQGWDEAKRVAFANDTLNLLAVDGQTNDDKGHKNAAKWLPPNQAFHCHYVARQIAVKARYGLWITAEEQTAMNKTLATCPAAMRVQGDTIIGADR